ncbi:MAG: PDZ domain-containing protein [Actinomyces sp.]|nr:MAG: PDZ domain-containing protein [Actinomyces sp.]
MTTTPAPPADRGRAPDTEVIQQGWAGLIGLVGLIVALGLVGGLSWLIVVLAIIVMIFLHELGHYLTALWSGMKVTEFFIGFGPRVWSFRRGETEYGVKAIPAGAYVRIIGMNNLDEVDPADEPRAYRNQTYPRRLLVALAGSTMHFLLAIALLFVLFVAYGRASDTAWEVAAVSPRSAAEEAGVEPGDHIVSLDGVPVTSFEQFGELVSQRPGETVTVVVERDGRTLERRVTIGERLTARGAEGIVGLVERDRILQVDGVDVTGWDDFVERVRDRIGEPLEVVVENGGVFALDGVVVEELVPRDEAVEGFFGVGGVRERERLGVLAAGRESLVQFGDLAWTSATSIGRFFTPGGLSDFVSGTFEANDTSIDVGAPLTAREIEARRLNAEDPDENRILSIYGAARVGAAVAEEGLEGLLGFLVLLNVFVGVFNLVPLLPLDGGHVAVATYERLRSRPGRPYHADAAKLLPLTYAVFAVLVFVGVLALVRDIVDPVDLGR